MSGLTAMVYEQDDVDRLEASHAPGISQILPLTPAAAYAARKFGIPLLDPRKLHSNEAHIRDIARRDDLEQFLNKRLKKSSRLSESGKQVLTEFALDACGVAWHLWGLLEASEKWLVLNEGSWLSTADRSLVHRLYLRRMLASWNQMDTIQNFGLTNCEMRFKIYRANLKLLKVVSRSRPIVINASLRGFKDLIKEVGELDPEIYFLEFVPLNGDAHTVTAAQTWLNWAENGNPPSPRLVQIYIPPRVMPKQAEFTEKLLDDIPDAVARTAVEELKVTILKSVEWVESILPVYRKYLRTARPRKVITYDVADRLNTTLAEAARKEKIPTILLAHTSISPAHDEITARAKRRRNVFLGCSPGVDTIYAQSPHAFEAARQLVPKVPCKPVRPFVWGYAVENREADPLPEYKPGKELVILHAGYYWRWSFYLPWIYETSHEYVAGLQALAEAVGKIPNVKLVIRTKSLDSRGEINEETLKNMLPANGCWEVHETGSFLDDLKQAHLLVSLHSASIEESLLARRPVLLFGGTQQRYLHLPARQTRPKPQNRAAVYSPGPGEDLSQFLNAILHAHKDTLLTDEELQGHIWPRDTTPRLPEFARELVGGPGWKKAS